MHCMHVQRLYCNVAGCLLLVERHPPTLSLAAIASINALFFAMVYGRLSKRYVNPTIVYVYFIFPV